MSDKGAWKLPEHEIVPESDRSTNMLWSIVYLGSFLFPSRAFLDFPWTCALSPCSNRHDCQGELKRALVRRILGRLSRSYSVRSTKFSLSQRIMEVYALQISFRLAITYHLGGIHESSIDGHYHVWHFTYTERSLQRFLLLHASLWY
jgi:hypothetical protein